MAKRNWEQIITELETIKKDYVEDYIQMRRRLGHLLVQVEKVETLTLDRFVDEISRPDSDDKKISIGRQVELYKEIAQEIRKTFDTIQNFRKTVLALEPELDSLKALAEKKELEAKDAKSLIAPATRKKAEQLLVELSRRVAETQAGPES